MNGPKLFSMLCIAVACSETVYGQGTHFLFTDPIIVNGSVETTPGPGPSTLSRSLLFVDLMRPTLTSGSRRSSFRLEYAPEMEVLLGSRKVTTWNHAVAATYDFDFGRRTRFDIGHSFVRSSDPARAFSDNVFTLPRSSFRQYSTTVSLLHDWTPRTGIAFRVDDTMTRVAAPVSSVDLKLDGVAGTVSLSRRLGERQKLIGAYSFLRFTPYDFQNDGVGGGALSSVPTIRAGISRFAMTLGTSAAEAHSASGGMTGGNRTPEPRGTDVAPFPAAGVAAGQFAAPIPSLSQNVTAFSSPFHALIFTFARDQSPAFLFEASGGAMRDEHMSYLFRMQLRKRLGLTWFGVEFLNYLSFFELQPDSIAPSPVAGRNRSLFTGLDLHVDGRIGKKTELGLSTAVSRSTASFLEHPAESLVGRGRIAYLLTKRWAIFAEAERFIERRTGSSFPAQDRQRYSGGMELRLFAPRP